MLDFNNLCMGCMGNKNGSTVCPSCGFNENEVQPLSYMPLRTLLDGRYLIGAAIESNCEGVTYLSWDTEENVPVRVREYFPESYCIRTADGVTVCPLSGKEFEYNRHLGQFIEIARCLARCSDLPSLFPVTDIFESNSTAYYVTEHIKTITMREFLIRNGGSLSWDQIRPLLMPVITTMSSLHGEGLIHCGISPETLIVGVDGRIRITGFCVPDARTLRRDSSSMNAQLFPGFAAIEQYETDADQGTWTDVYGLCATLYKILVGSPPADATERVTNDKMIIPAKIAQEIPRNVLSTLADGLAILSEDRTQTMDDLKNALIPAAPAAAVAPVKAAAPTRKSKTGLIVSIVIGIILIVLIIIGIIWIPTLLGDNDTNSSDVESDAKPPVSSVASPVSAPGFSDSTFEVPKLTEDTYANVIERGDVKPYFNVVIKGFAFNGEYVKGTIIEQSVAPGERLKLGETIEVTISLGSQNVSIPKTKGMTEDEAVFELLKLGFIYDNIKIENTWDPTLDPGLVVKTDPEQGAAVSVYSKITIYVNKYDGSGSIVGGGENNGTGSGGNENSGTGNNNSGTGSSEEPSSGGTNSEPTGGNNSEVTE